MTANRLDDGFDNLLKTVMQDENASILPSETLLYSTRQKMAQVKPRSKWMPCIQKTVAVAVCTLLLFIGAVNGSPAFASAAAEVPIVRELVKAVAFDPSLKAAIAHHYVQLVKQSGIDNGYRIDVAYLVADQRNLTVYYKLDEIADANVEYGEGYRFAFELLDMEGNRLNGCSASWEYPLAEEARDAFSTVKFYFTGDATLPEQVQLRLLIKQAQPLSAEAQQQLEQSRELSGTEGMIAHFEEPEPVYQQAADIVVPLTIDPEHLFQVRTLELQQSVFIEGQEIVFDKVELYPTQIRVLWHEAESNTQLFTGLQLELQSKTHGVWKGISNGVSGIGSVGEARETWLESNWFSEETQYQLAITQYALLSKDAQSVTYDYSTNTFTNLPEYIELVEAVPCDTGLYMEFQIQSTNDVVHGNVFEQNRIHQVGSGSLFDAQDRENGIYRFYNMFIVSDVDYENEPIVLQLNWAPPILPEEPIAILLDTEDGSRNE